MTLEVKPEQTELVKAAERSGTLSVDAPPPQDNKIIPSEGVTATRMMVSPAFGEKHGRWDDENRRSIGDIV